EPVVRFGPALAPLDQPRLEQHLFRDAVARRRIPQRRPLVRRVAEQEALRRLPRDAPPLEVPPSDFAHRLVPELTPEEVRRECHGLVQRPVPLVPATPAGLRDLDADTLRDLSHGVVETQAETLRSEERRVGKEWRCRRATCHETKDKGYHNTQN